jgi:cobyrinic acid a,c-diamide synthase
MTQIPRVLIAAPSSGSGKTTITAGIMAALSERYRVQGFKVGPDYIDPGYHTAATGRISRNLDTWMVDQEQVKNIFARAGSDADVCVIEGVMGLFDGYDGLTERGSTAEVAKLLSAPVILVIDAGKMARSAAAIALGFRDFDSDLNVAGVIVNNVGSETHARWVTEAIEAIGINVIGCMPRAEELNVPERHLGLFMAGERESATTAFIHEAAEIANRHVDMEKIFLLAKSATEIQLNTKDTKVTKEKSIEIAVARDEAFCFYYEDNLDLLREHGAEVVFFSPLHDEHLPPNISGIYLGGGYPELYAKQLADNKSLREELRGKILAGLPTYAECGGLMTLTEYFVDKSGIEYPMLGILSGFTRLTHELKMGYREVSALEPNLMLDKDEKARGHEFHYSEWIKPEGSDAFAYAIQSRMGGEAKSEGFAKKNLLASYVHLHFASNPNLAQNFVNACKQVIASADG